MENSLGLVEGRAGEGEMGYNGIGEDSSRYLPDNDE